MDVQWHTELSVEECIERLGKAIDPPDFAKTLRLRDSEKPVRGSIFRDTFRIRKRQFNSNPFAPAISGQMETAADGTGTNIWAHVYKLELDRSLAAGWFLVVGLFAIGSVAGALAGQVPWLLVVGAVWLMMFGYGLAKWLESDAQEELPYLIGFLRQTLEATEQPPIQEN